MKHAALAILFSTGLAATAAHAQPAPSEDEMLQSLSPSAVQDPCGPGSPCRGIRATAAMPAGPDSGTAPSAHRRAASAGATATASASDSGSSTGALDLSIEFGTGSTAISGTSKATLAKLGHVMNNPKLASYRFRVEGHTDTVGDPAKNQALSEKRAEAVCAYLAQAYHVDRARLEAVGMGQKDLAVQTPDNTPEPKNRRVHIVTLGG